MRLVHQLLKRGGRWLLLAWLVGTAVPALAHGGGVPRATNEPAGPYLVSVWTQPERPSAGETMHVTVAVAEPAAGTPVLGAEVMLRLAYAGQPATAVEAVATHGAAANRLFYEADLALPRPGDWLATVTVAGPDGVGELSFAVTAVAGSRLDWRWIGGGLLLAAIAAGLVWRGRRRSPPERSRRPRQVADG